MFFDMSAGEKKLTIRSIFIWERLFFDSKINKKDTCLVDKFKFTFDKSEDLQQKRISFTRKKKANGGKEMKLKNPILYPVTDFSPYFKIYVLEKLIKIRC
jgi:hypothetical protein